MNGEPSSPFFFEVLMPGPQQTRQLGSAVRIYRNVDDEIIAVDDVSIVSDIFSTVSGDWKNIQSKWHNSARCTYKRMLVHKGSGQDRVVETIQMFGDYKSITEDSGNYQSATWNGADAGTDTVVSLKELAIVGDTL